MEDNKLMEENKELVKNIKSTIKKLKLEIINKEDTLDELLEELEVISDELSEMYYYNNTNK